MLRTSATALFLAIVITSRLAAAQPARQPTTPAAEGAIEALGLPVIAWRTGADSARRLLEGTGWRLRDTTRVTTYEGAALGRRATIALRFASGDELVSLDVDWQLPDSAGAAVSHFNRLLALLDSATGTKCVVSEGGRIHRDDITTRPPAGNRYRRHLAYWGNDVRRGRERTLTLDGEGVVSLSFSPGLRALTRARAADWLELVLRRPVGDGPPDQEAIVEWEGCFTDLPYRRDLADRWARVQVSAGGVVERIEIERALFGSDPLASSGAVDRAEAAVLRWLRDCPVIPAMNGSRRVASTLRTQLHAWP